MKQLNKKKKKKKMKQNWNWQLQITSAIFHGPKPNTEENKPASKFAADLLVQISLNNSFYLCKWARLINLGGFD